MLVEMRRKPDLPRRRPLNVATMVADAKRGYIDDGSVARPPYGRATTPEPGAQRTEDWREPREKSRTTQPPSTG